MKAAGLSPHIGSGLHGLTRPDKRALGVLAADLGGKTVGLSGTDGGMIRAHLADERLGLVQRLLDDDCLPIIVLLGQGTG
jgi:hypothetical protein